MVTMMTIPRRQVAAALLFLCCAGLAGVIPRSTGVEYQLFGITEGLLGILLTYLLIARGAWPNPQSLPGWLATAYGAVATAQALKMLLPPAGIVQWIAVIGLIFAISAAMNATSARGVIMLISTIAVLLALLKFSVIPFIWERAGPAPGEVFGLGNMAESFRRLFVELEAPSPSRQLFGLIALTCWASATRVLWTGATDEERCMASVPLRKRELSGE